MQFIQCLQEQPRDGRYHDPKNGYRLVQLTTREISDLEQIGSKTSVLRKVYSCRIIAGDCFKCIVRTSQPESRHYRDCHKIKWMDRSKYWDKYLIQQVMYKTRPYDLTTVIRYTDNTFSTPTDISFANPIHDIAGYYHTPELKKQIADYRERTNDIGVKK